MESIRFTRKDLILIGACVAIFAASLWVGIAHFEKAFPEASVDFTYDRRGSEPIALGLLDSLGLTPPDEYRHASRFSYDNRAKTFLEKELGLEQAQGYFGDPVRLWYWQHRWFKPSTKEEFKVSVSPSGEVTAFRHLIEETAPGDTLSRARASALARDFLYRGLGRDSSEVVLLEASMTQRPNRADWEFTWRARGFEPVRGAEYRYQVSVLGGKVGGYDEYLHVPEAWLADYSRLRSYNSLAGSVASFLMLLTAVALIVVFIGKVRKHDLKWRTAIIFGIVAAVLMYLNSLNGLPNTLYGYDTTTSWGGFLLRELLVSLLMALGVGVLIALLTAGAETMYRERYPAKPALPKIFTRHGLRTKSAFINILVGITMTGFFIAYQVVFYITADRLGGWSPADVPYTNLLNTAFPFIAVLLIGFMPAVSEEFLSRMFSIPFLQRILRGRATWFAVLLPAFIWGFGHAGYPQEPFWIRGVEVGVAGIIVGVIMLRFGILAPLVWHYTVDALYTAMLLFRSENTYFVITAAVATGLLVIPLAAALIAYLRTGTFLPERGTLNADQPRPATAPASQQPPPAAREYAAQVEERRPLPLVLRLLPVGLILVGLLITPPVGVGDFMTWSHPSERAKATFEDSLAAAGWADPETLQVSIGAPTLAASQAGPSVYLLKHLGSVEALNERYAVLHQIDTWQARAWTPGSRLRYEGMVNARSGDLRTLRVLLPEEAPGDSLAADSARALVERAMRARGVPVDSLRLVDQQEKVRPARVDHSFTFEAPEDDPRHVGESKLRWHAQVLGSRVVVDPDPFTKLPEQWQRDRRADTTLRTVHDIVALAMKALLAGYALTLLVLYTRKGLVPWRRSLLLAILPALLILLGLPGMMHQLRNAYFNSTELPWNVFFSSGLIGFAALVLGLYLVFVLVFALMGSLYSDKRPLVERPHRRTDMLDTAVTIAGTVGVLMFIDAVEGWLVVAAPGAAPFPGWLSPGWQASPFAAGDMTQSSLMQGFLLAGAIGLLAHLWQGAFRRPGMRVLLVVAILLGLQSGSLPSAGEWGVDLLGALARVAGITALLLLFVKGRPTRFVAMVWTLVVAPPFAAAVLQLENGAMVTQGWIYLAMAVVGLLIWLLAPRPRWARPRRRRPS